MSFTISKLKIIFASLISRKMLGFILPLWLFKFLPFQSQCSLADLVFDITESTEYMCAFFANFLFLEDRYLLMAVTFTYLAVLILDFSKKIYFFDYSQLPREYYGNPKLIVNANFDVQALVRVILKPYYLFLKYSIGGPLRKMSFFTFVL